MTPNEPSVFSPHNQSPRYERYVSRMGKVRKLLAGIRRHWLALTVAAAAVVGLVLCFLSLIGHFSGQARCADFVYGQQPDCGLKAFLSRVEYEYAAACGEPAWSSEMPVEPGQYRIRAVSKNGFGVRRYSEEMTAALLPRELTVSIRNGAYIYGTFSEDIVCSHTCSEGLLPEDCLADVVYTLAGTQAEGYDACIESLRIVNAAGRDVTAGYALTVVSGTFTMEPRPITVSATNYQKEYDGLTWDEASAALTEGTLVLQDRLEVRFEPVPAEVGTYTLLPQCRVLDAQGRDVSHCYSIHIVSGTLRITPRPITLYTGSAEKTYDEEPLTNPDWGVVSGSLIDGHTLTARTIGSRTDQGGSGNALLAQIWDANGKEVTHNYQLTVEEGMLTIHPIVLRFRTASKEKVYDGEHMGDNRSWLISGDVLAGHKLYHMANGFAHDAGTYKNTLDVTVRNSKGKDVTANGYRIEVEYGTLTIHKRPLTVLSDSAQKLYDRTPLICWSYRITKGSIPDNYMGEGIRKADFTGSQTEVGSSPNSFSIRITDKLGAETTHNYDITYEFGTLTVLENPNPPADDGIKPSPGGTSTGIGKHGTSTTIGFPDQNDQTLYAVISKVSGVSGAQRFYFRDASYGAYNTVGWAAPKTYSNQYSHNAAQLTYVGRSLVNIGARGVSMTIERKLDCPMLIPYHLANRNWFNSVMTDCYVKEGDYTYNMICYPEMSYSALKDLRVIPGDRSEESQYRQFVYEQYLQIPQSTRAALEAWAKEQGLSANSPTLVADIQQAVKNAALYNANGEQYPQGVDVAVYFLTVAKEGVCQHFATAGTLLYRLFGIPARYTVGFADYLRTGEETELTGTDAHAWVEIYVDGLGWVPIEVTGSNVVLDTRIKLSIQAYSAVKYYDGKNFTSYDLERYTILSGALKEGHRLAVSFETGKYAVQPGTYKNSIKACKIYDQQGRDVTDQYNISRADGTLQILRRKITIATGSASKQYDGEPLTCDRYWIAEGTLAPGDELMLNLDAFRTWPGRMVNAPASFAVLSDTYGDITQWYEIKVDWGYLEVTE